MKLMALKFDDVKGAILLRPAIDVVRRHAPPECAVVTVSSVAVATTIAFIEIERWAA